MPMEKTVSLILLVIFVATKTLGSLTDKFIKNNDHLHPICIEFNDVEMLDSLDVTYLVEHQGLRLTRHFYDEDPVCNHNLRIEMLNNVTFCPNPRQLDFTSSVDYELLVILPDADYSAMVVSHCVAQSFSRPWFHMYTISNDKLQMVSTFTGTSKFVEFYSNPKNTKDSANLGGQSITVTYPPYTYSWFFNINQSQPSYISSILNLLAEQMNFTIEFVKPKTGNYGSMDSNGNFSGMMGELQNDKADMAVGEFSFTKERSGGGSQSVELWQETLTFFYASSFSQKNIYWQAYIDVIDPGLWVGICVIASVFIICFGIMVLSKVGQSYIGADSIAVLLDTVAITLKAFVGLGFDFDDNQARSRRYLRVSLLAISICGAMVFWHYNSCLISYLTVDINEPPFRSFEELSRMPRSYKVIVFEGSGSETVLKDLVRKGKIDASRVQTISTLTEGINLVLDGKGSIAASDKFIRSCQLQANGQDVKTLGVGWYFNHNFVLKNEFNRELFKLREKGFLQHLDERFRSNAKQRCDDASNEKESDSDNDITISGFFVASLFVVLLFGILLSTVVASLEKLSSVFAP